MIQDYSELSRFYDKLYDLERDEIFFVSLSCRNKYLSEEERKKYHLSGNEMFCREFIFEKNMEKFVEIFEKMYHDFFFKDLPEKGLVTYFNLNPTSSIKAYLNFKKEMDEELVRLVDSLHTGTEYREQVYHRFKNSQSVLKTQFQKYRSRKILIDVDFDVKSKDPIEEFQDELLKNDVMYFTTETRSGYHVTMKKDTIHFNYNEIIERLNTDVEVFDGGEIIVNEQEMIPVPGTMQGGNHLVRIIEENWEF